VKRVLLVAGILAAVAIVIAAGAALRSDDEDPPTGAERASGDAPPHVTDTLGFYTGSPNGDGIDEFFERGTWLGEDIASFTAFGEGSSIEGFRRNANAQFADDRLGQWAAKGETPPFSLVYSLPLAFGDPYTGREDGARRVEQQWDALIDDGRVGNRHPHAAGLDRAFYRDLAQRLADLGFGDAVIRLGSEHDIGGSRWSSRIDEAKFKGAYRAVVTAMHEVAPELKFDFTSILLSFGPGPGPGPAVANAYPGDDVVDFIGIDVYDQGRMPDDIGVEDGDYCGWQDPDAVFETYHRPALETARLFAEAHGKALSIPEWGLSGGGQGDGARQAGQCGGDNPVFVEKMHEYLSTLPGTGPGSLGYHSYFEGNPNHDGPHALEAFPNARERFRELFGRPENG
jgi:hypothetical protein